MSLIKCAHLKVPWPRPPCVTDDRLYFETARTCRSRTCEPRRHYKRTIITPGRPIIVPLTADIVRQ